jgi:predicted transcriptional regulator of viral defense system
MARHGIVTRTGRGTYVLVYVNSKVQEHILGHLRQSREPVVTSVELSRQLGWTQAQITTALSSMISRGEVVCLKPGVYALPLASKEDVSHDPQ